MRLILIRHGASFHSLRGIIANGPSCPGLTDVGLQQAELLARRLRITPELLGCHTLLSSPVLRAYQTADVIARSLNISAVIQDRDLTEIDPGQAEGLSWEAYRSQFGEFDLPLDPSRPFAPGGENWLQFIGRAQTTLNKLAETYAGQTVLVVTHAGFIVASLLILLDIPRGGNRAHLEPLHASLTEWQIASGRWTLARYNDTAHLV
jgi:2,3-bisphosphoglycerate-dependent phosphoglycerate mutase